MVVTKQIGGGAECSVYAIKNKPKRLLKVYNDIDDGEIDNIVNRAKEAFKAGIGPQVFDIIEEGYVTEKVKTLNKICCRNCEDVDYCCSICSKALEFNSLDMENYEALIIKAESLGFSTLDLHIDNVGIKHGKLILIDFGQIST